MNPAASCQSVPTASSTPLVSSPRWMEGPTAQDRYAHTSVVGATTEYNDAEAY